MEPEPEPNNTTDDERKARRRVHQRVRRANALVKTAAAHIEGERQCHGRVKLRPDMKRRAGPDNPYLLLPTGEIQTRPCEAPPIRGGTVCVRHGGRAPQVRKNADRRLLAMVEPSLIRLEALIHQEEHMPTALGAIRTVLERAGSAAIGPLKTDAGEKDARPIINIGIKVGGIDAPVVKVMEGLLPAAIVDAEVTENIDA